MNMICWGAINLIISLRRLEENRSVLYQITKGTNYYDRKINNRPIHAEIDAINKLPKNKTNKVIKINILVIRATKNNELKMSMPCVHCLYNIVNLPNTKGYIVKNIYYSNNDGQIIKTNTKKMIESQDFHLSKFSKWRL